MLVVALTGCTADDMDSNIVHVEAIEMKGFEAVIESGTSQAGTRGTVTDLDHYVGRNAFVANDQVVFTSIKRTASEIAAYTYTGISFNFDGSKWNKAGDTNLYWSDATSGHTFIGYSLPQGTFDWTKPDGQTYYIGTIGDGGAGETVDYSTLADLANEDLLITYSTAITAQACPSLSFHHALSSVRVVVNINSLPSGTTATVSDMYLLHQPTKYVWKQIGWTVEPVTTETEQVRKKIKLMPAASNTGATHTFYGITIPQSSYYLSNDTYAPDPNNKAELTFKVTYTTTTPASTTEKTYTASQANAVFEPGYNTTININIAY